MIFNSIEYLLFLAIVFILHSLIPKKVRKYLLIIASFIFYASHQLSLTLVLIFLIVFNYLIGHRLRKNMESSKNKILLKLGIIINVLLLCFYKYIPALSAMLFKYSSDEKKISWIMPLGLSFIVFQLISYLVDSYKNKIEVEYSFIDFILYVSFFPKVIQGPIVKARDFLPQIGRKVSNELIGVGAINILWGLFMKMVVSDRIAMAVNTAYSSPREQTGWTLIIATCLYGLQLYFDFAGYSLIAIGSAKLFGVEFKSNFRMPYLSTSVSEFWRRWHISLNEWLLEYIYIPLGGSRRGFNRYVINILITFAISGIWHGSTLAFLIWGLLNGVYIIMEKIYSNYKEKKSKGTALQEEPLDYKHLVVTGKRIYVFVFISFTWLFFRAGNLLQSKVILWRVINRLQGDETMTAIGQMIAGNDATFMGMGLRDWKILVFFFIIGIIIDLIAQDKALDRILYQKPIWIKWPILYIIIFVIIIFGVYGYGYSANSFIYQQF